MLRAAIRAGLLLVLTTATAHAAERHGFLIGFTLGGGALDCEGCESSGAGAFGFHLGGSVRPRLALAADIFGVTHDEALEGRHSYQVLGMLQFWPSSRLWIGGGLGYGQNEIVVGSTSEWGPEKFAFAFDAGFELVQRGKFALDLRGRYGRTSSTPVATEHVVALVGFTWY